MTVLVTGGAGYIGSHTVRALRGAGRDVVVLDSLELGRVDALLGAPFVEGNVRDATLVQEVCNDHGVTAIIHFAAYKSVGESMQSPGKYWHNNVDGTATLVEAAMRAGVRDIVFSSSCSVYGTPAVVPVVETAPIAPESVYAESKAMVERILQWYGTTHGLALDQPALLQCCGRQPRRRDRRGLDVLDQPDPDGDEGGARGVAAVEGVRRRLPDAGRHRIRDYIHVEDLAEAHIRALDQLGSGSGRSVGVNVGTGIGSSVFQVLQMTEEVAGRPAPYEVVTRRARGPQLDVRRSDARRTAARLASPPGTP